VFTPTFNRVHTLPRVYESLKAQIYRNFEWIIVDDGSTDQTNELVKKWQKEAEFPIRYFWQQNEGKHVAFNRGVREAHGEIFLPFDSDDACVPEALERFKFHWDSIPIEQRELFTGVCALCMDQNGKIVGDHFPFEPTDSNSLEIYYRYKVKGEKWGFQRTEVLHHYPFPEIQGARYIPEGVIWNAIAKSYKIRFVNEALRIYWIQITNDSDQITQTLRNSFKYAIGAALYYESCLNEDIVWFRYAPLEFLRSAVHYIRFSLHSGKGTIKMLRNIRPFISKMLVLLTTPIGAILYAFEKRDINVISILKSISKAK
jgi:glycosyltransferase involved in cell wall biosynthesis